MRPASLLLVLALLGGVLAMQQSKRSKERRLAAIASEIAGRDVSVHFQGYWSKLVDISGRSGSVAFDHNGAPLDYY